MNDPTSVLPTLTLLTGPETGRRIPLTTGRTAVIGRSLEADLTFPDEPSLSRLHARIEREDDRYSITDLGSANGTRLNGTALTNTAALSHGDLITCGSLELRFDLPGAQRDGAPVRPAGDAREALSTTQPRIRAIIPTESRPSQGTQEVQIAAEPLPGSLPLSASPAPATATAPPAAFPPPADQDTPPPVGAPTGESGSQRAGHVVAEAVPQPPAEAATPAAAGPPAAHAPTGAAPEPAVTEAGAPAARPARPTTSIREESGTPARPTTGPQEPAAPAAIPLEEALAVVPLFQRLSGAQRAILTRMLAEQRFAPGADLVRQGEEADSLYVILEGEARMALPGPAAGGPAPATLGPGRFFGEIGVLDGLPRAATVTAVTAVRCAVLPHWSLEVAVRANPGIALELLAVLAQRLAED